MIKVIDIRLNTNDINNQKLIFKNISEKLNINQSRINNIILSKKSIDSRNKKIKYQLRYKVFIDSSFYKHSSIKRNYLSYLQLNNMLLKYTCKLLIDIL